MANTTAIKTRIKAVKSTKQITKAMELVSASKMRKAQDTALRSRDYRDVARSILTRLCELTDVTKHPLYSKRRIKSRILVAITSDRGLAGAYNSNVLKQLTAELQADKASGIISKVITIGKQGSKFVRKLKDVQIAGVYDEFPENPTANEIRPILNSLIGKFTSKEVDVVDVIFTDYKSSISQLVGVQRILPAAFERTEDNHELDEAIFEPSVEEVLASVTERLIEAQLNQTLYESQASEQSMRMLAMKNATDNANDIIDDLTLAFNSARQAAITQELAEITGGAEAIK